MDDFSLYLKTKRILIARIINLNYYENNNDDKKLAEKQKLKMSLGGTFERANFLKEEDGNVYGHIQLVRAMNKDFTGLDSQKSSIHIEELDYNYKNKDFIDNCLIIFIGLKTAEIIGYYKDARVFRKYQKITRKNILEKENLDTYIITTKFKNAKLFKKRVELKNKNNFNFGECHYMFYDDLKKQVFESLIKQLEELSLEENSIFKQYENQLNQKRPNIVISENNSIYTNNEYYEGQQIEINFLSKKRNLDIVKRRKIIDNFSCVSCAFNFKNQIVECHHLNPISNKNEEYMITENDLITLCPNCHRMAHYLLSKSDKYKNKNELLLGLKQLFKKT